MTSLERSATGKLFHANSLHVVLGRGSTLSAVRRAGNGGLLLLRPPLAGVAAGRGTICYAKSPASRCASERSPFAAPAHGRTHGVASRAITDARLSRTCRQQFHWLLDDVAPGRRGFAPPAGRHYLQRPGDCPADRLFVACLAAAVAAGDWKRGQQARGEIAPTASQRASGRAQFATLKARDRRLSEDPADCCRCRC